MGIAEIVFVAASAWCVLLTFGAALWYPSYGGAYGLSALEDQQLGGLVMWGPASLAYLAAGLVIASRWLLQPRRTAG